MDTLQQVCGLIFIFSGLYMMLNLAGGMLPTIDGTFCYCIDSLGNILAMLSEEQGLPVPRFHD